MDYIYEKILSDYPQPITLKETETILRQMRNNVYRVCKKDGSKGTGFFCRIPISSNKYLPVFITNNHIIDQKYLNQENNIIVKIKGNQNDSIKSLSLRNKFTYTNKDYDTTIIEINENNDNIYEYLELDGNILNDTINYVGNSIYVLHYPGQNNVAVSYGILKKIFEDKKYNFMHYCSTDHGSSGAPILNLENNKIIGIHSLRSNNENYNVGSFLYYPIKEFINNYNYIQKQKKLDIKKGNNYIFSNLYKDINKSIMELFNKLYNKGLVSNLIRTKNHYVEDYTDVIKFIIPHKNLPLDFDKWIPAWHGTKFKYLESIVENGLKLPGTQLKIGMKTQNPNNIPLTNEVLGIKQWENAIFASQNLYYALGYCDDIDRDEEWTSNIMPYPSTFGYKGVVKIRIIPNSFTKHKSQFVVPYFGGHFSLQQPKDIDDIYRIPSDKNVIVTSIVFINNCYVLLRHASFYRDEKKCLINFNLSND